MKKQKLLNELASIKQLIMVSGDDWTARQTAIAKINELTAAIAKPQRTNEEWYTPPWMIERARLLFAETTKHFQSGKYTISLDPASNGTAQRWIQAEQFFTKEINGLPQDGLSQDWATTPNRTIWCNPPYGKMTQPFLLKGLETHSLEPTSQLLFLVNRTGADWYRELRPKFTAICELHKRVAFIDQNGVTQTAPRYYNDLLYLGRPDRFEQVFHDIGDITVFRSK